MSYILQNSTKKIKKNEEKTQFDTNITNITFLLLIFARLIMLLEFPVAIATLFSIMYLILDKFLLHNQK